uniref:ATP-dependent Clp protease proteolytic subunit n=1 Tax=Ginkgo biloba TaxID=3311 RepID=H9A9A1_GINBI|nr:ATP-dependent Clp protease proteolytic subunit [Ginkgo biloba]AEQ37138.1 ATP-dependent Clp protease proteolytic subunit [Ginkgo biloba]AEX98445.1 ATP-dependent Clp protease proteolytic subunit [Ginkgo biloba]AEX98862.1 ATP-dependent Clp protease proteolytic subunit [Ginkgo biloba]AEX99030.1 ATP-dependent Clp protease proteolytic subunit [Ginkgo biloba]QWV61467.1 ATP-dependent Clp protease proteolytic subunit [Ginkgo biloba]
MPIGVPKVPFRIPGEEDAVWVDVNRLHRERLLFLGQQVDDEIANQLIGIMMYPNGEDENKDIYTYINSPGGTVIPGISLYDAMQFVVPDVHTICMGLAASMGSSVSTGGEITKRIALPHAMIHQPASSYYDGQAGECIMEAEEVLKLRDSITNVYVQRTGKPLWVISEDMERDIFMSAAEAQAYGIVDLVAVDNTEDLL